MMSDPCILVADDHPLFLRGIVDSLHQLQYRNILMAGDGISALQQIIDHKPDVAILDIEMPYLTGLEVAKNVREKGLPTRCVIISYQLDQMIIRMSENLNIMAYILKEDSISELNDCLKAVLKGQTYFSKKFGSDKPSNHSAPFLQDLTPTEKKILKMIADDMTSKAIADAYNVSVRTVEKHRSNIIEKLSLQGTSTALIIWAKQNMKYL